MAELIYRNVNKSLERLYRPINARKTCTYFRRSATTALAVLESSPVVGSSRNKIDGLKMSSIPMFVLFRSPPDTPRINSVPIWNIVKGNANRIGLAHRRLQTDADLAIWGYLSILLVSMSSTWNKSYNSLLVYSPAVAIISRLVHTARNRL